MAKKCNSERAKNNMRKDRLSNQSGKQNNQAARLIRQSKRKNK